MQYVILTQEDSITLKGSIVKDTYLDNECKLDSN
jgi:hypothetical protein